MGLKIRCQFVQPSPLTSPPPLSLHQASANAIDHRGLSLVFFGWSAEPVASIAGLNWTVSTGSAPAVGLNIPTEFSKRSRDSWEWVNANTHTTHGQTGRSIRRISHCLSENKPTISGLNKESGSTKWSTVCIRLDCWEEKKATHLMSEKIFNRHVRNIIVLSACFQTKQGSRPASVPSIYLGLWSWSYSVARLEELYLPSLSSTKIALLCFSESCPFVKLTETDAIKKWSFSLRAHLVLWLGFSDANKNFVSLSSNNEYVDQFLFLS
jgi:hypothetical protein